MHIRFYLIRVMKLNKNNIITHSLLLIAALLLICIGSFAMTKMTPSLYIALFYLGVGIIMMVWTIIDIVMSKKKDNKKVPGH